MQLINNKIFHIIKFLCATRRYEYFEGLGKYTYIYVYRRTKYTYIYVYVYGFFKTQKVRYYFAKKCVKALKFGL